MNKPVKKQKKKVKRQTVSIHTWTAALAAVNDGMSLSLAAKTYGVSRESLRQRHLGLVPIVARPGPQLVYISEGGDRGLVEIIVFRALHGMCISFDELRCMLRRAAEETGTRPLTDEFPNDKYITRWIQNHREISVRRFQLLDVKRAESSSPNVVMRYFNNLKAVLTKFDLLDRPECILNCDETGICPQGLGNERVICPKGFRANVQASSDRENTSIMACISASGARMSPMYIFKGTYRKLNWMEGSEPGAVCAMSHSSNINDKLFLNWFKWFVEQLPPARPQLLILDGHFSHIQFEVVKYGQEHDVHLFVLPAHTSNFLQPLDVSVFGSFKRRYQSALKRFPSTHNYMLPTKDNIAEISRDPLMLACRPENAKRGFEKAGIYPLSMDKMMKGIVGNAPVVTRDSMPHLSIILGQIAPPSGRLTVTERQKRVLREMNLDVEGLNLVNLLRTSATALIPQKRKDGKWVVENYSGGDLLSYEEMKAAVRAKEDAKALKEANKKSGPLEKREQAAMNLHDKKQYQTARTQLVLQREEKRNAKAQQAAHRTNKKDPGASKLRKKPPPASQPSAKRAKTPPSGEASFPMSMVV